MIRAGVRFLSRAPGISGSWRGIRGRAIPARFARLCLRAASALRPCPGSDEDAIPQGFKTGPALSETFSLYKSVPWPAYSTHCSNRISSPRSCSPLSFLSNWSPNWSPMRSAVQSGTSGDTAPLAPSGRDADLLRGRALHYHAYCPLHEVRARHMPRARGKLSRLAGNYGKPLCGRATDANSVDEI